MRRRQLMRSRGCSRTASWRTDAARAALAVLLLGAALPLGAQSVDLSVGVRNGIVSANVTLRWERQEQLVSSLRDGLESRITFTVRLFRGRPSPFPFLGESLVVERRVSRNAYFDVLEQKFAMESEDGSRTLFERPEALVSEYLHLPALPLGAAPLAARGAERHSVAARVQFEAVRLMPPLGIVSFAGAAASYTSPWVRKEVEP